MLVNAETGMIDGWSQHQADDVSCCFFSLQSSYLFQHSSLSARLPHFHLFQRREFYPTASF